MPIEEQYNSFDDQLYEQCCRKVAANMIANGWNKHARKFDEVKHRKARQLYNNIA